MYVLCLATRWGFETQVLDMYDESIHEYGGGFSGGNGFLFDGLGNLAYVFIIPVLFCLAQAFLIINSVKKVKR